MQLQKALKEINEHGMTIIKKTKKTSIVFLLSTHVYWVSVSLNLHTLKQQCNFDFHI